MSLKELLKSKKFWLIMAIIVIVLIILFLPIWGSSCGTIPPEAGGGTFCNNWNFFEVMMGKAVIY